jgi:hypothetical protein
MITFKKKDLLSKNCPTLHLRITEENRKMLSLICEHYQIGPAEIIRQLIEQAYKELKINN